MRTTKSLLLIFAITANLAFAQDKKTNEGDKLIQSDLDNAKKEETERVEKAKKEQETQKQVDPDNLQSQEPANLVADKEAKKNMTPGAMQALLAESAGEWDQTISVWSEPGKSPVVSNTKCTISMILGGRYQKTVSKGKMAGKDFEGQGIIGYDNSSNLFKSSWIDNQGTGITNMSGKYNAQNKTIDFNGQSFDQKIGSEVITRQTLKFESKSSMVLEQFVIKDQKEVLTMRIAYKRAAVKK